MTTITKQFTQYLHANNLTWGELEPESLPFFQSQKMGKLQWTARNADTL
jgi:hypothetical protein